MSQSDRAIKKLATQLARLDREVKSWRGAQADYTSIEAGTMDINDSDGNLVSRVGFQDDGSGAVRFFDGPVPPVPSGVTATADGPIIQATWDGTFEGGAEATYDLAYLEVAATQVDDGSNVSFATITAKEGASASVVADVTGDWVVAVRSVSQAGKKSEFATAGTVEVKVTDVAGAIEAVQDSANGKNKVTYSSHAPTENDPGIFDDTWFVGQVGRPDDVVEATNYAANPSLESSAADWSPYSWTGTGVRTQGQGAFGDWFYRLTASETLTGSKGRYHDVTAPVKSGEVWTLSIHVRPSRTITMQAQGEFRNSSGVVGPAAQAGPSINCPANQWTRIYLTMTAAGDATVVRFQSYLRSATLQSGDTLDLDGEVIARGQLSPYFDGDTEDGTTNNESHYRWTGEPHASTSEKYLPALDIGESSNWNIIEQYRHDGNGWVKVELSHRVFSTVDLGKATVGELDGIRIMAKTISGDLFTGDAFDGIVFRGNTFTTRDGNGEFSGRGLFFQKPDGTSIFRVPTDGTPISMSASDVQIERAQVDELDLNVGRVRSGGLLELSSGVTPPAAPPELNTAWARATTLAQPESDHNYDWTGLARWGNKWVRAVNVLGAVGDDLDRIEIYNPDGTLHSSFKTQINPRAGVTVLGDTVYTIGPSHDVSSYYDNYLHGYDLNTGSRTMWAGFTRFYDKNQKPFAIGNDGTNILVAGVTPTPRLYVMRYDPATGEQVGSDMTADPGNQVHYTVSGVTMRGGKLYVFSAYEARVYVEAGGAWSLSGSEWFNPTRDGAGFVFVDDRPFVVDGSGVVFEGSTRASDYSAEVCFTWYDGTYETTPSPVATINVAARETVTISLPYREGLQKRVYVREGARWRRNTLPAETTVADLYTGVLVYNLPTSNSFPAADPAVMRTTNNTFRVRGDGSGNWGPLTLDSTGVMSGVVVSGRAVCTVDTANVPKKHTIQLPPGRFTKPPVIWLSPLTSAPQNVAANVVAEDVSATSFGLWFWRTSTTVTGVDWMAMDAE